MFNFDVGLSGLRVAQKAIELIGTNIVNAGTEGYHRQTLRIAPREYGTAEKVSLGGAEVASVMRSIDHLLEREVLYQQPLQGQVDQELSVLELIEQAMGELGSQGLARTLSGFFNAMAELAGQPDSLTLRQQAAWVGQELCQQFNQLAEYLRDLSTNVANDATSLIGQANSLIEQIATANQEIRMLELRGASTNILRDQRDQAINELAQLVDVQIDSQSDSAGMVNVSIWGTPVVTGATFMPLEAGLGLDDKLGVTAVGGTQFTSDITGGQVGALVALRNSLIPGIQDSLDLLAQQIIQGINSLHAQGIGIAGSFSELTGEPAADGATLLSQLPVPIQAGVLSVRVIDLATGQATMNEVTVGDPAAMTLDQLVAALDAVPGLGAALSGWTVHLQADAGYQFDFLPASHAEFVLPDWSAGNTSAIEVLGSFSGSANQVLDVRVEGGGQVGVTEDLSLAVYDVDGNLLRRFNVGLGYAAGDRLSLNNGLSLSLGSGALVDGDRFELHAQAASDTAGILTSLGLNSFFTGRSAADINVRAALLEDPNLIATATGADGSDNANASRMAQIGGAALASLDDSSPIDYFAQLVSSVGQEIELRRSRQSSLESVLQQLTNYRDQIGGVDINDEAAKLILFERMFQAAAKFMTVQGQALEYLMNIL